MARAQSQSAQLPGFTLGRLAGVEIRIDPSLAIIFLLILFGLGTGWFPRWHPDWGPAAVWLSAAVAAVLFFASVLAHELSHALIGRRRGIAVPRITLFMFGGLAHMDNEPPSAGAEFQMAIIGPIASIAIGVVSLLVAQVFAPSFEGQPPAPAAVMSQLGPAASILFWLGFVNLVLGVFNMVPGFPLDGGRVLRAGLWHATGDRNKATLWSSYAGRGVAAALIAYGVYIILQFGAWGGLWSILIGWFLYAAAKGSYDQLRVSSALGGVTVRRVMRTQVSTVPDDISVAQLIDDYVMVSDQSAFPVVRDGHLLGLVTLEDVRATPREQRDGAQIREIMTPGPELATVGPDDPASEVLDVLTRRNIGHVPVVEAGRFTALVRREDILRWLSLHGSHGTSRHTAR